ncbi:ComEA family DNA-binding protein [Isoptericola sp. NPDC056605]|uniref:ComEA family DNA-binding protein n=1 Tax=Isoptericola sp. NPDC056605 TaxID=3345876 RepID=UPI00368994A2
MTTTLPPDHGGADAPPPATFPPSDAGAPPRPRTPAEGDDRPGSSGPEPDRALGEAAARLRAWHALREDAGGPPGRDPGRGPGRDPGRDHQERPDGGPPVGPPWAAPVEEDELADRLRARRSAQHVAAAYTAAHGHPVDGHDDGGGARRWSIGLRAAVVASVAVLLVAVVVAVVASARPDDVITLADASASSGVPTGPSSPSAGPSTAADAAVSADSGAGDPPAGTPGTPGATPAPGTVVVHVVGEVREPGLVTVPSGARVADAVAAAGGTTRRADAAALNLARAVVDGEQIRVPRPGEQLPASAGAADESGGDGTGGGSDAAAGGAVNLNSAGAAELEALPGIGPALAGRIVAWRDENGPFTSVDELDEVSGIGPSVLGQVRDLVTL